MAAVLRKTGGDSVEAGSQLGGHDGDLAAFQNYSNGKPSLFKPKYVLEDYDFK